MLDLLRGERQEEAPRDPEEVAREVLTHVDPRPREQKLALKLLGAVALLWLLAVFGLISLPVDRTQTALVYQAGEQQGYTTVRWDGVLRYSLHTPWTLEFRGQVQTPLAQTTLDPERDLRVSIPLAWDRTTHVRHKSWRGNVHSWEGPFVGNDFYLDWWGGDFAFSLTDSTIVATSPEAYGHFLAWEEMLR